ncbi:hypothetical protein AB0H77_00480 [Streptomyces sp. NPDC050844]|uniref:hypothetical protein n=1 Tax=Streptomyces sp. NPDC050844 TaxID=3155790 RepID=UPI0033C71F81
MALQDDLTAVQRCVDELVRTVDKLTQHAGAEMQGIDVRRVRTDTDHLRESFALLRATTPGAPPGKPQERPDLVRIPEKPYDTSLWTDSDDEGLGAKDRHAP